MPEPLLEPALLVTQNCKACHGTGILNPDRCEDCNGSGREVGEMPMSAAFEMASRQHAELTAPPPSMVREEAIAERPVDESPEPQG